MTESGRDFADFSLSKGGRDRGGRRINAVASILLPAVAIERL
jgi:hypothetical protein